MNTNSMTKLHFFESFYVCPNCGASDHRYENLFETLRPETPVLDMSERGVYHNVSAEEQFSRCKICHGMTTYTYVVYHTYTPMGSVIYRCAECGGIVEIPKVDMSCGWECHYVFCSDEHRYELLKKWNDTCAICGKDIGFADDAYYLDQPVCSEGCYIKHMRLKFSVEHAGVRATQKNRDRLALYEQLRSRPYPATPYRYRSLNDIHAHQKYVFDVLRGNMVQDAKKEGEQHE